MEINRIWLQKKSDNLYLQSERAFFYNKKTKALDLIKKALFFKGESPFLRHKLAGLYVLEGLSSQAAQQYQVILKGNPENSDIRIRLAKLYREKGLYNKALKEHKILQKQHPRNFDFEFEKALAYREAGLYNQALKQIEKIDSFALRGEKIKLNLLKAHVYKLLQNPQLQRKTLSKVIVLNPVEERFVRSILVHYMDLGDIKGARDYLLNYQRKNEFSAYVAKTLSEIFFILDEKESLYKQLKKIQAFGVLDDFEAFQLASLLVDKKQYNLASSFFADLLSHKELSSSAHYFLGFIYEQQKEKNKAKEHYQKVLSSDEYFFNARIRWAYLLKEENQWPKALGIMKKLTSQFRKTPLSFLMYARFLKDADRLSEAVTVLSKAVTLFPGHLELLFLQGFYLEETGKITLAIKNMEKILKIDPNHVEALNFLAYAYAQNGGPLKSAEIMARKALSFNPKSGYILDTLGWVLYKKGQWQESLVYLKKAFHASPKESVIAEHLGEVYHKLRQYEKSAFYFKKAADLEKDKSRRESLEKGIVLAQPFI